MSDGHLLCVMKERCLPVNNTVPKNFKCVRCEKEQYTNEKCYGCSGKVFVEIDNKTEYPLTTGQMIDSLQQGEIAINDIFGTCVQRKPYGFIWCKKDGSYQENNFFVVSDMTIDAKWKIV